MSRNLGQMDCEFCGTRPQLDEVPRPITVSDAGIYYGEFEGMTVANASCDVCGTKYLAWIDQRTCAILHSYARHVEEGKTHFDLSFRRAFNDEPTPEDLPTKLEVIRALDRARAQGASLARDQIITELRKSTIENYSLEEHVQKWRR